MPRWLFSSDGRPVAYLVGDEVFSCSDQYLGKLTGTEIWNGDYVGEILGGERLARKRVAPALSNGHFGLPGTPGSPGRPGARGIFFLPLGYDDVALT